MQTDLSHHQRRPVVGQLELVERDDPGGRPHLPGGGGIAVDEGLGGGRVGVARTGNHPLGTTENKGLKVCFLQVAVWWV